MWPFIACAYIYPFFFFKQKKEQILSLNVGLQFLSWCSYWLLLTSLHCCNISLPRTSLSLSLTHTHTHTKCRNTNWKRKSQVETVSPSLFFVPWCWFSFFVFSKMSWDPRVSFQPLHKCTLIGPNESFYLARIDGKSDGAFFNKPTANLVGLLIAFGWFSARRPVWIQSFDLNSWLKLRIWWWLVLTIQFLPFSSDPAVGTPLRTQSSEIKICCFLSSLPTVMLTCSFCLQNRGWKCCKNLGCVRC